MIQNKFWNSKSVSKVIINHSRCKHLRLRDKRSFISSGKKRRKFNSNCVQVKINQENNGQELCWYLAIILVSKVLHLCKIHKTLSTFFGPCVWSQRINLDYERGKENLPLWVINLLKLWHEATKNWPTG